MKKTVKTCKQNLIKIHYAVMFILIGTRIHISTRNKPVAILLLETKMYLFYTFL